MKHDTVSIIIPIYKVAAYLNQCVASACAQTYPHLQIILVDDGSPDECGSICDAWAQRDSRIVVIHKKNGGLSDARNAGLDAAVGKYIYFLDGDDYIEPNLVETVLQHMKPGVDLVAFPYLAHRPNGAISESKAQIGCYELPDGKSRAEFVLDILLQYKIGWEAWSRMYIREKIERYHLRFADNREIFAEDLYFFLCYCARAEQVVCIPDALYHYILRTDSIMGANQQKLNIGRMDRLARHVKAYYQRIGDCQELLAVFPQIYYYIIMNVLGRARDNGLLSGRNNRKKVYEDLDDPRFFKENIRAVLKDYRRLEKNDVGRALADKLSYLRYVVDGFYPGLVMRSRYLYKHPERIDRKMGITAQRQKMIDRLAGQHFDIYVIGTEDFGNIGDHQIARSILAFLGDVCPGKTVIEVTASMYSRCKDALKQGICHNALIVLTGGGNFGDLYPVAQDIRQDVIDTWPQNRKIVFPQTIRFSESDKGQEYLFRAKKTYTPENNVLLVTRETVSYDFAKQNFTCPCLLTPDIVLWSKQQAQLTKDGTALLVLRSDEERASGVAVEKIPALQGKALQRLDHQLTYSVELDCRERAVQWVWKQYQKASIVITDRLHGMIFAAVTGTPCVAVPSCDHKIPGTYRWLEKLPYVRLAHTQEEAEKEAEALINLGLQVYAEDDMKPRFEELVRVVKEYADN